MHIEPGILSPDKMILSYGTAALALAFGTRLAIREVRGGNALQGLARSSVTSLCTFVFFQVFPHFSVGVSELHLIFGTALFLLFGVGAASFGLAFGLLVQGLLFAPTDLPQYFANVTTLLVPLYGVHALAQRTIPEKRAYSDLAYADIVKLSLAYQAGVVGWVGFWVFYGQGLSLATAQSVFTFGVSYVPVVVLEPLVGLGLLALVKGTGRQAVSQLFSARVFSAAPSET